MDTVATLFANAWTYTMENRGMVLGVWIRKVFVPG